MIPSGKEKSNPSKNALFITFGSEDIEALINASGGHVNRNGYVINENGKTIKCDCCDKPLKVEHVGRFMPGSLKIICDDPMCISEYFVKRLM